MARCAYCKEETELYFGGVVPVCTGCFDAQATERNAPAAKDQTRHTLFQDFLEAMALYNEATAKYEAVIGQFPIGSSHPVGVQRIKNASSKRSTAREGMMSAYNRLNDYFDRGIVRTRAAAG